MSCLIRPTPFQKEVRTGSDFKPTPAVEWPRVLLEGHTATTSFPKRLELQVTIGLDTCTPRHLRPGHICPPTPLRSGDAMQ
jgi:hypothetical protein